MSTADEKRTWYVLDADCSVYNELMEVIGIKGLELVDLPKVKYHILGGLEPIYGIIFLFKRFYSDEELGPVIQPPHNNIFYIKQINYNANVLHAILSVALNCVSENVSLGSMLDSYKEQFILSNSYSRGFSLKNNEILRQIHNYFALKSYAVQLEEIPKDNNRYHYASIVPVNGRLYEIDGMKEGPVDLGVIDEENEWLKFIRRIIKRRIIIYKKKQISYKVMAMTSAKSRTADGKIREENGEKLQSWTLLTDFKRRRMSVKRRRKMKDAKKINEDSWSQFVAKWSEIYAESVILRNQITAEINGMEMQFESDVEDELEVQHSRYEWQSRFFSQLEDIDSFDQNAFFYKSQRKKLKLVLTKDGYI
ncbi:hypothetical protein R5R35_003515 [Gryllus longicercus]|uniref:ubiquitinyl hydrolase 1 n=1 Tax=Gryllus longicercus TaxID=2509291 RepID=A0AAN9Z4J5_9ORTH